MYYVVVIFHSTEFCVDNVQSGTVFYVYFRNTALNVLALDTY